MAKKMTVSTKAYNMLNPIPGLWKENILSTYLSLSLDSQALQARNTHLVYVTLKQEEGDTGIPLIGDDSTYNCVTVSSVHNSRTM